MWKEHVFYGVTPGRNTHGYGQDTKAMSGHPERKGNRVHSPTSGTASNSSTKHHNRGQGDKEGEQISLLFDSRGGGERGEGGREGGERGRGK